MPQVRRLTRDHMPLVRYSTSKCILLTDKREPESFQEVQTHRDRYSWVQAMQDEINSLHKNNTYELVDLPKGKKALRNKWLVKLKKVGDNLLKLRFSHQW